MTWAIYILLIPIVIAIMGFIDWPEIPDYFAQGLHDFIAYLYTFNNQFPIDTMFSLAIIILTIESIFWLMKLISFIHSLATGRPRNTDGL